MADAHLMHISLKVNCDCSKDFISEDLEPECPFCGSRYSIRIIGTEKKMVLRLNRVIKRDEERISRPIDFESG